MQKTFTADGVTIRDVPSTQVAIMEHRGRPGDARRTIQRFRSRGAGPLASTPRQSVRQCWVQSGVLRRLADYSVGPCVGTDHDRAKGE
jgi:AraC family transcriptional regulator